MRYRTYLCCFGLRGMSFSYLQLQGFFECLLTVVVCPSNLSLTTLLYPHVFGDVVLPIFPVYGVQIEILYPHSAKYYIQSFHKKQQQKNQIST